MTSGYHFHAKIGAKCQDTSTSYNCQCVPGWDPATDGATDCNECQFVPCLNECSCNNLFNDFTCDCTGRYKGSVCETATRNFIDKLLTYNPSAKIGIYSYSDEPEEVFSITWSGDKDKRIAAALQIDLDNYLSPNLSHALQHLRISNQFTSLRKMVVIVSDGMWTDMDLIKKTVSYSEQDGIEVVGVVAGEDSVIKSYQAVLNDPSQVFYTEDDDFRALNSLTAMTKYYVCVNNIFSKRQ
ncbi:Hypothetical predicted protein [Mytilus galloprovincialis]|uniref:VWFA domain-containing protein n=1 Tax=Mytilus galloprovincialis TaxID=29158 RepID=A0A8B6BTQ0_MYTGA|nr:Hypothetical predicted protein [Mytilus galloprovincialis]